MPNPELVNDLLIAVETQARERLRIVAKENLGRAALEAVQIDLDRYKAAIARMTVDYDAAIPCTVDTVRSPQHDGQLVRMVVALPGMTNPMQYELRDESTATINDRLGRDAADVLSGRTRGLAAKFRMANGITTEWCLHRRVIELFQQTKGTVAYFEGLLFVTTTPEEADRIVDPKGIAFSQFSFFLVDMRPLETALQILGPPPGDIEQSTTMFSNDTSFLYTARSIVLDALDLQNSASLSVLIEAIEFHILSAATEGRRGSSIVLGPPSAGKSLSAKAAKLVHPIAREVVPTKITEAGLTGSGTAQAMNRKPGLIPQAHQGVLIAQDFNQANAVKNQRFISAVTTPMQDGYAIDSSVSMTTYKASIAVHIDLNRRSDVRRKKTESTGLDRLVEDTGVPINIWSRTCYAVELQRDIDAMIDTARKIMLGKGIKSNSDRLVIDRRVKLLQTYIAVVRDRFKEVLVPDNVRVYMAAVVMEAVNVTRIRMQKHPDIADFITRLSEQVLMLTEAHARLHYRGTATTADVDGIMRFIWRKLDFIREIIFGGQLDSADTTAAEKGRRRMIRTLIRNSRETSGTVADVRRITGISSATPATIEGDLRHLYGEPDANGHYNFGIVREG